MLQQTQVSRVADRFEPFLRVFPTPRAMAAVGESDVVREWSGLGYYRRARNLHKLAVAIVREHRGRVPTDASELVKLPGVGRYTAGAIASIVHGERVPIVDGNVARVLLRVHGDRRVATDKLVVDEVWKWSDQYVRGAGDPSIANEGLMELGALVCTPKCPRCDECPLHRQCRARQRGLQESIPEKLPAARRREERVHALVVVHRGRVLLAQRRADELWAGMMLPPMVRDEGIGEAGDPVVSPFGASCRQSASITFDTSGCRLHIAVWHARAKSPSAMGRWLSGRSTSWVLRANSQEVRVGVTARILEAAGV